jgi:putative ABC transport system permease protein
MNRLARWIIERALAPDDAEYLLGDLDERAAAGERGPRFWLEVVAGVWHLHARAGLGKGSFGSFAGDLRHGVRLLRRSPLFAAAAILTLAVAIGATTAIFSVVKPVLIDRLPYPSPGRLMLVWEQNRDGGRDNLGFPTFKDITEQSHAILTAAAVGTWEPTLTDRGDPERVSGERVSATFFRTLGVRPELGRDFTAQDDQPGHNGVVVLSHALWMQRYGGDPGLVGRTIDVNGSPVMVAGVMPASFENVIAPDVVLWRALGYAVGQPFACRTCRHLRMIARLREGISDASAAAEVNGIFARIMAAYPRDYASTGTAMVPMRDAITDKYRGILVALASAVVLVLLIAVANVTNLQLARAVKRQDEFAIRGALGAGRGRLTQMMFAEALVLAFLGGTAGTLLAAAALPSLVAHLPPMLPRADAIHLDLAALGIVAATILCITIATGVATASAFRSGAEDSLRSGRRLASAHHRARGALVIGEVSLALMLLVSAGLVARSLAALMAVDLGFDPSHLLTLEINSTGPNYKQNAQIFAYHDRVREAVRALPGVVSVGVVNQLPLGGNVDMYGVLTPDHPLANPELAPSADRYAVSSDYMSTMRVAVVRGRAITAADAIDTASHVSLVSQALAARLWPGEDAIGKRIRLGGPDGVVYSVVGVARNVKHHSIEASPTAQLYVPERQWLNGADDPEMLVVRTAGDPALAAPAVRAAIRRVDPSQPILHVATMDQVVAASTGQRRLALVLLGAFAAVALLLTIAGIYGVLAGSVAERLREIGLRAALGATPGDIMRLVVGQGARLTLAGVVIGSVGALGATRFLSALLYGVRPADPLTFGAVAALLVATSIAACMIPTWRAMRVDPSTTLRAD